MTDPTIKRIEKPYNFLGLNLLCTFFWCPGIGIIGVIFSYLTDRAYQECDDEKTEQYANLAKLFFGVSFVLGLMLWVGIIKWSCCR